MNLIVDNVGDAHRRSILRRMPADGDPRLPRFDQRGPIEVERDDGGPPGRSQTGDAIAFCRPRKVLAPSLAARVEQARDYASEWIERGDAVGFVIVTQRAGEPEV